jgi:mono/diheme cytochrome c family protein
MPLSTHSRPPFSTLALGAVAAAVALAGCGGRHSGAGMRLPDGDPARGQEVFVSLKCHTCHRVADLDLPAPTASPPVPVVLGGEVPHVKTDGELLTSIINPSHRIPKDFKPEFVKIGDQSRMPDYGDVMSVREAVDLIAFLQSRYTVVRPGGK